MTPRTARLMTPRTARITTPRNERVPIPARPPDGSSSTPILARRLRRAAALTLWLAISAPVLASSPRAAVAGLLHRHALGAQTESTVVFLVRHAERAENGTPDPPISAAGTARASLLAEMLRDAGITHVHTTDYRRTRATGRPTADLAGLSMEVYDPRNLERFAARLTSTPGRHLVLGHSNTTPSLVEALGGDPGDPIEELEYDRLYVVTLASGSVQTVLLRFGARYNR